MLVSNDGRRFAVDKLEIAALVGAMAPSERPSLHGVWLDPSEGRAWTANGHVAVVADVFIKAAGPPAQGAVMVPAPAIQAVVKGMGSRDLLVLTIGPKVITLDVRVRGRGVEPTTWDAFDAATLKASTTVTPHCRDGHRIHKVIPSAHDRKPDPGVAFDARLLKSVMAVGKLAPTAHEVRMHVGGCLDPVLFMADGIAQTSWRLVVMPRRCVAVTRSPASPKPRRHRGSKLQAAS